MPSIATQSYYAPRTVQLERCPSKFLAKDLSNRMPWRSWLNFYRYLIGWENYVLLWRAWQTARSVKHILRSAEASPSLSTTIAAVNPLYLSPQKGWQISDPHKIFLFANFIVGVPINWGRCVQRSLIAYRLLNGYGFPARFYCGIHRENAQLPGHAWVALLNESTKAFGEAEDPNLRFLPVFTSEWPKQ